MAQPLQHGSTPTGVHVAVVVPTYNEAENLPELFARLSSLGIPGLRLIIVDDGSPDGTAELASGLESGFAGSVEVVQRGSKRGLGTAYVEGFGRALSLRADRVVQMDADLSHSPEYLPTMLDALSDADVVVGSRYAKGGGVDDSWGLSRRLLSSLGNLGIRLVGGISVRDATSGFKAFRASALSRLDMSEFRCSGFGFQAEVAHSCQRLGLRVVEQPILFVDRTKGRSKMSAFIVFEAIWRLLPYRFRRTQARRSRAGVAADDD